MNDDTSEFDTVTVSIQVIGVERVNAGRLVALATVRVAVIDVEMTIQGVQVTRQPTGMLMVDAPRFRGPGGEGAPAVTLAPELKEAIANETLAQVEQLP